MPLYTDGGLKIELSRAAVMLDTNVLVAAFSPAEGSRHGDAIGLLENPEMYHVKQWLVPSVVVVEAWGMLRRDKGSDAALQMLRWLNDPGNPVVFCRYAVDQFQQDGKQTVASIVDSEKVDIVDAILMAVGEEVSAQCDLTPPLAIATFDYRDFPRLRRSLGARVRIFDMRILDYEDAA
jgi:predicted nucleic acid-binding protein